MTDQDRNITLKHIFIHIYRIPSVSGSQIYHMLLIFAVMTDDLPCMPEFIK